MKLVLAIEFAVVFSPSSTAFSIMPIIAGSIMPPLKSIIHRKTIYSHWVSYPRYGIGTDTNMEKTDMAAMKYSDLALL